jgi:eukaryotic-like serine/threonine-protein kinase
MGEVYRARDTRLQRDVAIKVLPASMALDADRIGRLQREAVVLASLNHPGIAVIHGLEEAGGVHALVLELIDGPTLADRIARGPIPVAEALGIARQVADALVAAHDNGVIHRDLKPANIKLRPDGVVKVLDFGLAKMLSAPGVDGALSHSPTMMASMPGVLAGTAAYMSPEQARGHEANRRADIWAFGCVLFEMLAGRRVFDGATTSEVLAEVLKSEPDWAQLPAETPESIRRVLRRCLQKDAALRLRDIGDARLELEEARRERLAPTAPTAAGTRRAERLAWAGTVTILAIVAAAIGIRKSQPLPAEPPEVRFDIITRPVSDPLDLGGLAVSPDGRTLVYSAADGPLTLWSRPLDSASARPLPGTGGALFPFFSPDGRSLAFATVVGELRRLDLDGGLVRTLVKATATRGGSWNRDGQILYAPNPASPIFKVSAEGGVPSEVTRLAEGHAGHGFPHFLPDGRHFLFYVTAAPDLRGVYLGDLDGSPPRRLLDADTGAAYIAGHLLFVRQAQLLAQPFDASAFELRASPFEVANGVLQQPGGLWSAAPAVGKAIAFRVGSAKFGRRFEWVTRAGATIGSVGEETNAVSFSPSPDLGQVVFFRRSDASSDLWTMDTRRAAVSRLTSHPAEDIFPLWSRDGSRILFSSNRGGQFSLYEKRRAGSDAEKQVVPTFAEETFASDTSQDGRWVFYQRRSATSGWDIWKAPLDGTGEPAAVVQSDFDERSALLSPDGKWLVYIGNSSGSFEVYVSPFPGPGATVQVSTRGGAQPRWRSDGRELFYVALDGKLMATSVGVATGGETLDLGTPVALFQSRITRVLDSGPGAAYVPSPDGQRFLINAPVQDTSNAPIRVIVNWKPPTR